MIKKTSLLLLGVAILGLGGVSISAQAQEAANEMAAPYTVDKGPVELYGITIDPYTQYYESEANTGPRWDQIRYLVPEVFPDAKKGTLTANEFCHFLYNISKKYTAKQEVIAGHIAYALRPHFPEITDEPTLMDQATLRLHSRDEKDLVFLLEKLPHMQTQIMMAKEWTMKMKVAIMLFDAAAEKTCPEYAQEQGFRRYSASFYMTE